MDRIRDFERKLIRAEGLLCVVLVLLMLVLAGYNVLYRNVLVPLQTTWAHSGPPVTATSSSDEGVRSGDPTPGATDVIKQPSDAPKNKGSAGGFGGAFGGGGDSGGEDDSLDQPAQAKTPGAPDKEDGGFGGAFGAGADEDEGEDEEGEGGFGGAFGKPQTADEEDEEEDEFFVEDEFANLPEITAEGSDPNHEGPEGGPPAEGSFAAWGVEFIDSIKLDWIDVFLRQLVIVVSFLGAAIATQRKKHINIDALSKLLRANGQRIVAILTNMLAISVCLVLANAGGKLVQIGREYPQELVPFAEQWVFQLMFPIGFGLLAFHFGVRLLEAAKGVSPVDPAEVAAGSQAVAASQPSVSQRREGKEAGKEAAASAPGDSPDGDEPDDDSADEETDVGNDSDTSPGDEPKVEAPAADSEDESLDEGDGEEER